MTDFGNRNSTPIKFPVNPRLVNSGLLAFVLLILAVFAVVNSWYTIDQGDRGILLTNGAAVPATGHVAPVVPAGLRHSPAGAGATGRQVAAAGCIAMRPVLDARDD